MSDFIVSARKYRPATFSSVVGQKHITSTLKNAIERGQLAHAYLFCGPRGVGKTTCARIFAKAINCLHPEGAEACNACEFFFIVKECCEIYTFDANEHNLDNINQGKNLFSLVDLTGEQRYRDAINTIRAQLDTQPRTKDGNFWHKAIYPWQVWLDGTYMAQPFYMEYETRYNGMKGCQDSYKQFMNIKKYMRDPKTGLYYHGYDESRQMYWADPVTGCSANFWLRAMGWFLVAMVDVLERMDEQMYYEYRAIMAMFKEAVEAMIQFQDAETGMFWQVVDKAGVPGNYLETSGSSLFAYAVLKGVRLGYLPKRFRAYGEKAFYGTCDKYLGVNDKGELQLSGICLVAGLGGATRRDGSLEYYFSEPVVENDAKGVAPLLLAYTEMIIQ